MDESHQIEMYLEYLKSLVQTNNAPDFSFDILFNIAWDTNYEYYIPNDLDRYKDGLDLRERFTRETSIILPGNLGHCRMLEFLIAVAIRCANTLYDYRNPNAAAEYFWELIENLELDTSTDEYLSDFPECVEDVERAFTILNRRQYGYTGSYGGLFPLENPEMDQRKVDVWYQMSSYLLEKM